MHILGAAIFTSCILAVFGSDCEPGTCKEGETCCPSTIPGDFSCCPYENAVCCEDHVLCCPENTVCNIIEGSCDVAATENDLLESASEMEKRRGLLRQDTYNDLIETAGCNHGTCARGETCCPTDFSEYICCAYENAVCCPSKLFCCPEFFECDEEKLKCVPLKPEFGTKLEKRQGLPAAERPYFQNRCDDTSYCPYDGTCCISPDGTYSCCPYMHATCCSDKNHCCPKGEACDVTSEYCIGEGTAYLSKEKEPAIVIDEESLV